MKLTPEEYLLILNRRNELELTEDEKEFIRQKRLSVVSPWSRYLQYVMNSKSPDAKKIYDAGRSLQAGDITYDEFKKEVLACDTSKDFELGYMVDQMIKLYK